MADHWLGTNPAGANLNDIATKLQIANQIAAQMLALWTNLFPRVTGSFTMAAASSKTVTDANVSTTSFIVITPTNAAAATLMAGANSLYVTAGSGSFVVVTAAAGAAAGTETFAYAAFSPL